MTELVRCGWAGSDPLYQSYHDQEWGVPLHDDRQLFELLVLEGAQAGLSWITVLRKRDSYRRAFAQFDAAKIARFGDEDVARLLGDAGIVRNRLKVAAAIQNAKSYLELIEREGSFDRFVWSFVGGQPLRHRRQSAKEVPAQTAESLALSKALAKRGFRFVGPTIVYAFMQAAGMVNDHVTDCFRWRQV